MVLTPVSEEATLLFRGNSRGNSSVVERHLAKVDVAGSSPVSRSRMRRAGAVCTRPCRHHRRRSQVAKAEDCKSLITGSNPVAASSEYAGGLVP